MCSSRVCSKEGYPQRNPVDRRQSRKNMGKAIVTGLNTARVKEIKGRLRPAFSPDELIDSVERRNPVGGGPQDVIENVDVSGMSIMERMKVLESKAASSNKGPPPPTYPKPRPVSFGAITVQPIPHHSGRHSGGQSGSPSSSVLNDRPAIPPSRNDRPAIPSSRSEPRLPVAAPSSRPTSQVSKRFRGTLNLSKAKSNSLYFVGFYRHFEYIFLVGLR